MIICVLLERCGISDWPINWQGKSCYRNTSMRMLVKIKSRFTGIGYYAIHTFYCDGVSCPDHLVRFSRNLPDQMISLQTNLTNL